MNLTREPTIFHRDKYFFFFFPSAGTAWGYIESFLFWLIQDLGGSRSLMGITITVGGIAGIPLLVLSGPIISKIGHANVLFIGFVFYAIRLCGEQSYLILTSSPLFKRTTPFCDEFIKKKKKITGY